MIIITLLVAIPTISVSVGVYLNHKKNIDREIEKEIHSGRNHIVRRIFESLGYEVVKLDRVMFAGLTKQNLPRGHWRFLTSAEISMLKRIE